MKKHIVVVALIVFFTVVIGVLSLKIYVAKSVKNEIAHLAKNISAIKKLSYSSLNINLLTSRISIKDLKITPAGYEDEILIDGFHLVDVDGNNPFPSHLQVVIEGVHLDPDNAFFSNVGPFLKEMKYNEVSARIGLYYQYDPYQAQMNIKNLSINAEDMGQLSITARLSNFDIANAFKEDGGINRGQLIVALPRMAVAEGTLTFENDSLIQRWCRRNADQTNQSVDSYLETTLRHYKKLFKKEMIRNELDVIEQFLKNPDQITAVIAPPKPISFFRLLFTKEIPDLMALLHVTFKRPNEVQSIAVD